MRMAALLLRFDRAGLTLERIENLFVSAEKRISSARDIFELRLYALNHVENENLSWILRVNVLPVVCRKNPANS
jgi:hypothetical protein